MQFDVVADPDSRSRGAFPYAAIMQSDFAETGAEVVVAFLVPKQDYRQGSGKLAPGVVVGEGEFVLLLKSLTNVPRRTFLRPIANLSAHREKIVDGLDWLFTGV